MMAKAHTLVDNFNDNIIDQYHATNNPTGRWLATVTDQLREVNGRVEIQMGSNPSAAYYTSAIPYDLTGSEVRVELVRGPRKAPHLNAFLAMEVTGAGGLGPGNSVSMGVRNGSVSAYYLGGTVGSIPYDPTLHRWLRIREAGAVMYWETSPDGDFWTPLGTRPIGFDITQLYIKFGVWSGAQVASPGLVIFDNLNVRETALARRVEERRRAARDVRVEAAELAEARRHDEHANNNDEVNYAGRPFIGSYSKSLKHDSLGDPEPISYGTLLRALQSEDPADFEEIQLASSTALKLTNPQAGLTFDIAGPDAQAFTLPPAPRFDSEAAAHEAGELYWMAVARDVHFASYAADAAVAGTIVKRAIDSLNTEFPQFGGTVTVTAQNLFRGIYPGEQVGPYVSQYLLKGNNDPRKMSGAGRNANEGFISYGSRVIDQRQQTAEVGIDYLTTFSTWLDAQNGVDFRGQDDFDLVARRFIRSLRDGATFVHFDQVLDAYYNAAWILMSEPTGNQLTTSGAGRPQIDLEFPKDQGNPYDPPGTTMDSRTQVGFATFGPTHLLQVLAEVLGRALRAVWWQKWGVHRRLRPEEYGGRVHNHVTGARTYPLHASITNSLTLAPTAEMPARLSQYYGGQTDDKFPSYLLPQAYPEGAPTHPAYGAGHATGSGALVTILKAFFDESTPIENPVQASSDGLSLVAYTGGDAGQMTVGGELNKLAGNIALFRNAAGVHWRSDYTESLPFGEAIAIGLLQEMSLGFNEDDAFFELTKFDGQKIRIFDGKVEPVIV
jgi:hypothetical protein